MSPGLIGAKEGKTYPGRCKEIGGGTKDSFDCPNVRVVPSEVQGRNGCVQGRDAILSSGRLLGLHLHGGDLG